MSLVTVIKDYIEIVHKIIETSPAYLVQHTTYTDSTTLYFYLVNTFKNFFTDIFTLDFFQKIAAFPIIVPSIADSMISEISVLDGTFHNVFTFLDAPLEKIFSTKTDFIVIICLEKFFIGLLNSLFLWLPTSAATFLCLRRFVMQGMEIGYIAAIGTMTANIFWLMCVLFGIRWIVIPWMSLDILRYWLGFMLLIKYFWDNRLPAKEIKSDLSLNIIKTKFGFNSIIAIFGQSFKFHGNFSNPIQQIFLFHFLLAFTEQTSLYPFLSHFSLSAQSTYLESFPSNNFIDFILIHSFYLLGIFIGSFSFINFICWFWEEPAYKVYLWTTKNFQKIRVGDMVRITHFIFQTLTILLACASLPYFSIEYFITKPLGFLPNDQIFHQSQNHAFLTHSTSPILYRSPYYFPRQRFFRYDDWAEYYGKNIPLDTSLYDQGAYRLYPIEDLHYGADYEWTRRRSNHVKIRSRMKRIMWFPRNWATQIWDLAKTWSRRNVAWRNEILSQYQNNWDSKSAPFWEQIVREELLFGKEKSYFKNERKNHSPWAASQNWSQKFLISGEGFWWNWWAKNTISDNQIWWNWILTKKNQIIIKNSNELDHKNFNKLINIDQKNNQLVSLKRDLIFSNYQKLPSSYRLDYWIPQERLISLYSEQSQRQKNQFIFEIATLRKLVRKINKRVQINSNILNPLYTSFSIKNAELYYKKYVFSNSVNSFINNIKNVFFSNQRFLLNSQIHKDKLLIDSNKILNCLLNGYSLANQSNSFNKWNNILINRSLNETMNLKSSYHTSMNNIKQSIPTFSKNVNYFINDSTSLFLTLPAQYYLHKEQSFSRKLQFYGVRTSREFKPLNNSPIFNFYMKTYFHQYKPTRLYIANTKMKRDLGAGGRNRFKSRQYANKQLKKARILSKTPWIRQWISQSGFLTRRKRLESWIRYSHYNSNEIWAFIMKADIDNFIKRQPSNQLLTNNEERLLHLRRFLLGEHYETLRWYSYMQHYRSMKAKIGGTKSFANRMYNQQFKGTFHKIRHLFALTPSLNGGGMLTFDQLLYNEFQNDNKNSIFNKELIHEELLADTKTNINSFLVKDKKNKNWDFNFYSDDIISKSSELIKEYILEIIPIRQKLIQKLLKDKNYVDLTNILWLDPKNKTLLPVTNQIPKTKKKFQIDFKRNSIRSSFSIDQQKKFQSMLILMFNKRRFLAKDYKRGSERLWKKWRKNFLIQKQISKQNNIEILSKNQRLISFISSNNVKKNINKIEQTETLPRFRVTDQIQKTHSYYKNILKNKDSFFSYQNQATIRKALKDSVSIQKYIFNQNALSKEAKITNFGLSLNTHDTNFQEYRNQQKNETKWNVEKRLDFTKDNFHSKLAKADKIVVKKIINQLYKKSQILNKIQLKYLTLDYWFKNLINVYKYKWHVLNLNNLKPKSNININNKIINNKNKQEELFNLLSYLQNQTIRERLEINKKILTMTNYNQIDSKFFTIRASRHLKRARISQRKKLSQHIQKYKNFFHIETENIKKINAFKLYKTLDFSNKMDFKLKLMTDFSSSLYSSPLFNLGFKNKKIYDKINNLIESYNIDFINKNIKNSVQYSSIFNIFQPFLESFYYVPRLSTLWQSNLINTNSNIKSKIDMGSIYETKQNLTPIGTHKELFRQNFNTKNKIQDNIKRKLLDNHLNRFSERRRWNNQYQTIDHEITEQLKKVLEIVKQNQTLVFNNQKLLNKNPIVFTEKIQPMPMQYNNKSYNIFNDEKQKNFSLHLQKSIQNLNGKEIIESKLLSSIIDQKQKDESKFNFSLLSSLQLNSLFNKLNNKKSAHLIEKNQFKNINFWNKNISFFKNHSNLLSNFNDANIFYYSTIKELIMNNEINNQSIFRLNKEFFDGTELNNSLFNSSSEIKKEKSNQKKLFFKIINHIQTNTPIKEIYDKTTQTYQLSKNVEKYLINNIQHKIEKQLQKLENRLIELSKKTNQYQQNNDVNTQSINSIEKQNKILITQKKLITKRIQFLTNLNEKFKTFEIGDLTLPIDWKTSKIKKISTREDDFGLKNTHKQYYFSKKSLNLLVKNCNNFIQYVNLKKDNYLKKQNKIFFELLKSDFFPLSNKKIQEEINKLEIRYPIKNTIELTTNLKIHELLKKPIIQLNDSNFKKLLEKNKIFLKPQQSEKTSYLSVNSSLIKLLLKKQKFTNFDEILGSLLAIQKRGNALSQKNIYYKKLKYEWNKNKFNNFSKGEKNGIKNFLAIRTWTNVQRYFNDIPINKKLFQYKDVSDSLNSLSIEKKTTRQNFLSIENFIKESILKPQRFEKQQSRKRLKFKKLPRQEHFKNLQIWENSFKQKEDMKNKQFFDDLSQSFQKWKSFGFFPQKTVFQKQIINSATFVPSSTLIYKENNKKLKKFGSFYDTNFQTITNLDIIKQIEYDHFIQKELNFFLNSDLNKTNKNSLNNKKIFQIENNEGGLQPSSLVLYKTINSQDDLSFYQLGSKKDQEQTDSLDKDIISKIYEKFFVKSIITKIDKSQINKKILIGINTFPFYAGWDESLRKFVITNRLLSRRDAGYQINSNMLFKDKENQFNIEFTQWPLQGRNAATTFFCHFPFINQPSDFSETIQYKNRTQFKLEEINTDDGAKRNNREIQNFTNSNKFIEKNDKFSIKRIKKQKQELRNENRRNITNLVGPNEIQNRRKAIFYPLKWKNLKSNTKKIILMSPLNEHQNNFTSSDYNNFKIINNPLSNFSILKEKNRNYVRPLLSKFHLLRILRKGNTGKIRLPKLRLYKKYIKKENDILESSWRTFLSKRKLRSYNFLRQKNIRTIHLLKVKLGNKLQWTKVQWLFRKNNSRANRQSENKKNKSGTHYLRPRKKSLRRRSLGIKYKRNQQITSLNNLIMKQNELSISNKNLNKNQIIAQSGITQKMNKYFLTDLSNLNLSKSDIITEQTPKQNKIKLYETPYNWIQPNNSTNLYNILFKTSSIYTPTLYSILPGHGRYLPKMETLPLPKSSVQTIKRAIRLANFEPASFIQREVLSYEWSMKQLIQNMTSRLNNSANQLILKYEKNNLKNNKQNINASFSIDLLIQRHLRLFKKKLIHNPIISPSSNAYLSQFSRQRTFQKRSIRLRKFNMTLAMNLYDRWFFYYYTGGREDPFQNLFQNFEKLAQNISSPNMIENSQSNQSKIFDDSKVQIFDNSENLKQNFIFKSIRKFLTQKLDQKRSFNTFLTNLKTKKSKTLEVSNEQQKQNLFNSTKIDYSKNNNSISFQSSSDEKRDSSYSMNQWWHLFQLFPQTIDGKFAQKKILDKLSNNKTQKKQQEKDLEEDRFYFLKATKSPIIQDFRSSKNVNRHYPLNGGFIWPGDYLRFQTIMLPKEKKYKYFYNKNLVSEIKNAEKLNNKNLQTSNVDSNSKINDKIQEFQNYVLELK